MQSAEFSFFFPFVMLTFGFAFLFVARAGVVSARHWGIGYLLAAAAFLVPVALVALPLPVQSLAADILFLAAFCFYGQALLVRFGRPRRIAATAAFAAAVAAAIACAVFVAGSIRFEVLLDDLACALVLGLALFAVRRELKRRADKVLGALVALVVVDTLVRTSWFFLAASTGAGWEGFTGSSYFLAMQATASCLALLLALTVLAGAALDIITTLRDAAERDPMTGLLNRRGFERAAAAATAGDGAVIACDIDHFKLINDGFGHVAGDRVLAALGALLTANLPKDGVAARFGGEEFVLFLPKQSSSEAVVLADGIRSAIGRRDWSGEGTKAKITASFGVASARRGRTSLGEALAQADRRLYAAKAGGRDRVVSGEREPGLRIADAA